MGGGLSGSGLKWEGASWRASTCCRKPWWYTSNSSGSSRNICIAFLLLVEYSSSFRCRKCPPRSFCCIASIVPNAGLGFFFARSVELPRGVCASFKLTPFCTVTAGTHQSHVCTMPMPCAARKIDVRGCGGAGFVERCTPTKDKHNGSVMKWARQQESVVRSGRTLLGDTGFERKKRREAGSDRRRLIRSDGFV